MAEKVVITENDVSQWSDKHGELYHFPSRYFKYLQPGTEIIYYKGRLTDKKFKNKRLSDGPHYFGTAVIGHVTPEQNSTNYFATIRNFRLFAKSIPFKIDNVPLEQIPNSRQSNYWRDGVRPITEEVYTKILRLATFADNDDNLNDLTDPSQSNLVVFYDGKGQKVDTTRYERDINIRDQVLKAKGYTCEACEINFKDRYGSWGEGFIHVHHKIPVSVAQGTYGYNVESDFNVLCPNCHSMVHRRKDQMLTLQELKRMLSDNNY